MFCPRCGAEGHDQTRYCRSCGADLEVVALALNAQPATTAEIGPNRENGSDLAERRVKLQIDGVQNLLRGVLVFATGILLGVAMALFGKNTNWHDDWVLIWIFTCGWLPVWGAIMIASGLSDLIQARMVQHRIDTLATELRVVPGDHSGRTRRVAEADTNSELDPTLRYQQPDNQVIE
jgi:hypothetical protein